MRNSVTSIDLLTRGLIAYAFLALALLVPANAQEPNDTPLLLENPAGALDQPAAPQVVEAESGSDSENSNDPPIPSESQEDEIDQRFDIVLTLDEKKIARLRQTGFLKATLPVRYQNRVDAIVIKHAGTFLSKPMELDESLDKRKDSLAVDVDDSVLQQIEFQPIKVKNYDSGFRVVVLRFRPDREIVQRMESTVDVSQDGPRIYMRLKNDKGLYGNIKNGLAMTLQTDFGDMKIPFSNLAGVKFHADESDQAVVVLQNGDTVTGRFNDESFVLKTRWGDKAFRVEDVHSLTLKRTNNLQPPNESVSGRWRVRTVANN